MVVGTQVTALLNLAEFMEHDDKRLPLDTRTLGALAEKCHAFAKALHYKVRLPVCARECVGWEMVRAQGCRACHQRRSCHLSS